VAAASPKEASREGMTPLLAPDRSIERVPQMQWNRLACFRKLHRRFAAHWQLAAASTPAAPLIAFSIFLLSRPYQGIVQDGYIYIGRALADLDPNGVGKDMMYVHDGQFGFSLFRYIAKELVAIFGAAAAAKALALSAAAAWFVVAAAFARQFTCGGAVWVALIFAALLPASYGAPYPLGFAEPLAIPRPFAEALVLAALAALAARYDMAAMLFIAAAAFIHPIMAIAGLGVLITVRCLEDTRWFWFCVLCLAFVILVGALGAPFLSRLFTVVDPYLRNLHEQRSPFLFPSLWPTESFPPLIVQTTTIAIAAHLQQERHRTILGAVVVVGLGGVAITTIFGDWLSSLLILQAQLWRTAWLMAVVGAMALGLSSVALWRTGLSGRIVLALLVLCWSFSTQFAVAGPTAILTLLFYFGAVRFSPLFTPKLVSYTWIFTIVVTTIWQLRLFAYPWQIAIAAPAGYGSPEIFLAKGFLAIPLCALGVYFAVSKPRLSPFLRGGFVLLLLLAVISLWDQRSPAQRRMEENQLPPELLRLIEQRQGEVLWIGGQAEAWFILGRPQFASPLQGGPIIFSPVLAVEWRRRMQVLMDLRLADQKSFAPWSDPERADRPVLSQDGVRRLCARGDAPAWIIAPLEHGSELPAGLQMALWQLPEPQFKLAKADGDYVWQQIDAYGVIPCAGQAQPQQPEERG
jgi:hypothetical protein